MAGAKIIPLGVRKVTSRACPGCGYLVTQNVTVLATTNPNCPRCKNYSLKDFLPLYERRDE